jgi:predicted HTH transcriptional regulator
MFSLGSTLNKKRSGQGDESRQRKRSEAHWSLGGNCSTTNLPLNKFFLKIIRALSIMHAGNPRPTIDYEPGGIWIKFPFSTIYLAQVSNGTDAKKSSGKSSGKTEDKIIAIARKSPSVSIPQIAEILGISTRAVEKQIRQLKQTNRIRRIGPAKGGNWQVVA